MLRLYNDNTRRMYTCENVYAQIHTSHVCADDNSQFNLTNACHMPKLTSHQVCEPHKYPAAVINVGDAYFSDGKWPPATPLFTFLINTISLFLG